MQFVFVLQVDSICLKEKKMEKSEFKYCLMAVIKKNVILQAYLKSRN